MIPRIKEIWIQNYKSIEKARVTLEPFTVLVGTNGSGKSNFIGALEFVKDCVTDSLQNAVTKRGGFWHVCNLYIDPLDSGDIVNSMQTIWDYKKTFSIRIDGIASNNYHFSYALQIGVICSETKKISLQRELCIIRDEWQNIVTSYEVQHGRFITPIPGILPVIADDRPALSVISALNYYREVFEFISTMRFYAIIPNELRETRRVAEANDFLRKDGSNAVAILRRIYKENLTERLNRLNLLLSLISAGTTFVAPMQTAGPNSGDSADNPDAFLSMQFLQNTGINFSQNMHSSFMSDGTLRALGVLLAIYQLGNHSVIAIEEPEATIHPAASEVLFQAFRDAAHDRQILITTHSADILDEKEVTDSQIRVVSMDKGRTFISNVSPAGRDAIKKRLFTAGELMRSNELNPDLEQTKIQLADFDLFGDPFPSEASKV